MIPGSVSTWLAKCPEDERMDRVEDAAEELVKRYFAYWDALEQGGILATPPPLKRLAIFRVRPPATWGAYRMEFPLRAAKALDEWATLEETHGEQLDRILAGIDPIPNSLLEA